MEKTRETIKKTTEILMGKMGFVSEVSVVEKQQEGGAVFSCNITTQDASVLIGQAGETLGALQHLIAGVVRRKCATHIRLVVDINAYRAEKNRSVVRFARDVAEQAIRERRPIILRPMTPYERRIVHLTLAKDERVKTESIGENMERKVVVKPRGVL